MKTTGTRAKPKASSTNSRRRGPDPPPDDLLLFQRFCTQLRVEDRPLELYPEQIEIVTPYFEGVTETLVILSKKNGKSTLIAALVIFHLLTVPDADCVVVAVTREQAEIILRQAAGFIRRNPGLQKRLKVVQRNISSLDDAGRARVLAADEDTAEGVIPTLAIVDELHGAKSVALYDSLRMGLDGRQGRMVTITIAGSTMASPLGQKRDAAYLMPGFHRDPKLRKSYGRSENGAFVFLEWCLNPDDDPNDLDIVKLVNPAPWKTIERLAVLKDAVTPWSWNRLACGLWTEGEEPWVDPERWDGLADPKLDIEEGSSGFLCVRVGQGHDSAALVFAHRLEEKLLVKHLILGDLTKRDQLAPLSIVEEAVRGFCRGFDVRKVGYISKTFERSAELLEAEGYPIEELPQSPERMMGVAETLFRLVEEGNLIHDGDPELRAQVLAGRVKRNERGWRFVEDPALPRPIDGLLSLAGACQLASGTPTGDVLFGFA